MKVAVYTIALNEAAQAERWASSAVDADYRIVADTGSTDDTVERLVRAGVTVHRIAVRPWRFDVARNAAMALIPDDVDVCLSLDMDRFLAPGWRTRLEAAWTSGMTALFCQVVYRSSVDDPTPLRNWSAKNFHHRWGYRFKRPVHEALVFTGDKEVVGSCDDIVVYEVQDHSKTTRSQYLPLMELAHQEDPEDAQICFWLGREYMWANRHEPGIALLERYLALPASTWVDERSEAMRYLARLQPDRKMAWLDKARLEAPHRREIWLDLAEELHSRSDWLNLFWACINGLEKTRRTGSYLDEGHCWGFRLFDLAAIAAWRLDVMDRAVEWGGKALELDPGNQRLKTNLAFFVRRREALRREAPPETAPPTREAHAAGSIVRSTVKGQEISFLVTDPLDDIMKHHDTGSFYAAEELELIARHIAGEGAFVDIGANVGNHSVYVCRFTECPKIIAFEPNPAAIAVLKENIALNRCDKVDTRFLGVALAARKTRLSRAIPDPDALGHASYPEDASGEVSGVDGDSLIAEEKIELIKLDAGGMELDVLAGLARTIRRWQPTILVEVRANRLAPLVEWCARESYQLVDVIRRHENIEKLLIRPMGRVLAEAGAVSEPEPGQYLDAVIARPSDGAAWRGLAEWYRDRERPVEAAVLFARGGALEPEGSEAAWYARWQKARCLLKAGDGEGFEAAALEAFRLRPLRAEPLHDLARHHLGKSRGDLAIGYAAAGLALAAPSQDTLGVDRQVYETSLREAFTIAASYAQDPEEKERGRRICNWLALERELPGNVRGLARHNLRWYAEPAAALMPSIELHPVRVPTPAGFRPGSVSLVRHGAGFVALVRSIGRDPLGNGLSNTSSRQRILMVRLDERLQVVSSTEVLQPADMPPSRPIESPGAGDPRPFIWRGGLWCLSCVREPDQEDRAEMVLARLDGTGPERQSLTDWRVLPSATPLHGEENWMPQVVGDDLRFIRAIDPTRIVGEAGRILAEATPAIAAENFRGGSQAIPFDGGWLMLIHEWELIGQSRNYLHRFVWLDGNARLARLSSRFYFRHIASELAAGLAWHTTGEHLVVGFSDDGDPTLAVVRAADVRAQLLTIADHKKRSGQACEASRPAWEALSRAVPSR